MSATDPAPGGPTGDDSVEARLRRTLRVVADATPVDDPAAGVVPMRPRSSRAADGTTGTGTGASRVWRAVAAAAVIVIVIVGAAFVAGRRDRAGVDAGPADGGPEPTAAAAPVGPDHLLADHWHEAYGFYVCGEFLDPLQDVREDLLGIHTHGEGIIHIHPFSAASSGANATLGLFGDQVGVTFFDDGWRLPTGQELRAGSATCGGEPADVVVYRWSVGDPADASDPSLAEVTTEHVRDIVFDADRQAYTFAVVPRGTVPPPPPSVPTLDALSDVPPTTSGTTAPG